MDYNAHPHVTHGDGSGWMDSLTVTRVVAAAVVAFVVAQILRWLFKASAPNPFAEDARVPRKLYVTDQKKRDAVIKQNFSIDKVCSSLLRAPDYVHIERTDVRYV